jgi:hypothetical protein
MITEIDVANGVHTVRSYTPEELFELQALPVVVQKLPDISPRQIRLALTKLNMRTQLETAVAASSQDLKDWWEYSANFERNHPLVAAMATQLGIPSSIIDTLWITASTL